MGDFYNSNCPACGGSGFASWTDCLLSSSTVTAKCTTCWGEGRVWEPPKPVGRCPGCGVDVFTVHGKCRVCDRIR